MVVIGGLIRFTSHGSECVTLRRRGDSTASTSPPCPRRSVPATRPARRSGHLPATRSSTEVRACTRRRGRADETCHTRSGGASMSIARSKPRIPGHGPAFEHGQLASACGRPGVPSRRRERRAVAATAIHPAAMQPARPQQWSRASTWSRPPPAAPVSSRARTRPPLSTMAPLLSARVSRQSASSRWRRSDGRPRRTSRDEWRLGASTVTAQVPTSSSTSARITAGGRPARDQGRLGGHAHDKVTDRCPDVVDVVPHRQQQPRRRLLT